MHARRAAAHEGTLTAMTTIVWAVGLVAAVGALLYMVAYRRRFWWVEGSVLSVPRTLTPLYLSLALFSAGLALVSFQSDEPIALWVAAIWSSLALLFAQQLWSSVSAGFQAGWDTPLGAAGEDEPPAVGMPIWWIVAIVLLLANAGLIAWSANARWQAGTLRVDLRSILNLPQGVNTAMPLTETPLFEARATPTGALSSLGIVTPTAELPAPESMATQIVGTVTPVLVPSPSPTVEPETPTPEPVVIALPSPTPSPTPAPVLPMVMISAEAGANARAQPALDGEVFGVLLQGEQANALGRSEDSTWIQIQMDDGRPAWVATSVVTLTVDVNTLPVIPVN
jgi:uncharacterized protein YgiM (DUF1202 family)